jgi:hypothetical protein
LGVGLSNEQKGGLDDMAGMYKTWAKAEAKLDELINISIKKYGGDEENPKVSYLIFEVESNSTIKKCTNQFLTAKELYNRI